MALSAEEKTFLLEKFPGDIDSATDSDLSKMFLYHVKDTRGYHVSLMLNDLGEPLNHFGVYKHGLLVDSFGINYYLSFIGDSAGEIDLSNDSQNNFILGIATPDSGE